MAPNTARQADQHAVTVPASRHGLRGLIFAIDQAFTEFLGLPTLLITGFLLLAGITYTADQVSISWLQPLSQFLEHHLFSSPSATTNLLGTVAGGLLTVTSITFSLLLLSVQQTASNLTSQVYDQFFRRPLNQFYLGFFVGLALYTLIILATVNKPHNPVIGGTVDLLLTFVALFILILLLYGAVNQIRPSQVVESIHDLTLTARSHQMSFLKATRRSSRSSCPVRATARAGGYGYITTIRLDPIKKALQQTKGECEVIILVPIGSFVPFHHELAHVKAATEEDAIILAKTLPNALQIGSSRNIKGDPAYGIDQLVTIAWTSVSTAKQNLIPGTLTVQLLHDLLVHWMGEDGLDPDDGLPVVYPDNVLQSLMAAFEALAVISTPSLQYQIFSEIVQTFADTFEALPQSLQANVERTILVMLSVMDDHVLTGQLHQALCHLINVFRVGGHDRLADKVEKATNQLASSIGKLNTRSSRVPSSSS